MNELAMPASAPARPDTDYDAIVVGAGFAGLYMLHKLRELGMTVRVLEAADGVGGTWYWNRYPGARCDSESHYYCFTFSKEILQEWTWSCRYPAQPEILEYLNFVADRLDLRGDIQLNTRVNSARYNAEANLWDIDTEKGGRLSARFLITAVGCLSAAQKPLFPGAESFAGQVYHTGQWPHEGVDFTGKRVGIVGTGSSGIQAIPVIAEQAAHLTVFQRTPQFTVPARNSPMPPEFWQQTKANYDELIRKIRTSFIGFPFDDPQQSALEVTPEERRRTYDEFWQRGGFGLVFASFNDLIISKDANDTAADYVREKIRETVHDAATAETLSPRGYPIATKRLPIDTHYYETFNRDNVSLVDLRTTPIQAVTPSGIRTSDGERELDIIVFATGYDAMTGPLFRLGIQGRDGMALQQVWADGPHTYLGIATAGFPNLFMITGPGSPSVLSNMPVSIEQHVEWIGDCLSYMRSHGLDVIETARGAQDAWDVQVAEAASATLMPQADSWYMGANMPGKPRVFTPYVGGVGYYRQLCQDIADRNYEGFELKPGHPVAPAPLPSADRSVPFHDPGGR